MRIDKWMWAVRIFKSRTLAAEACEKGRITVNAAVVKASRVIKSGDTVAYSYGALTRKFEVIAILKTRVGAVDVPKYCKETTPEEDLLNYAAMRKATAAWRDKGSGRPTKKDRRELDDFVWGGSFGI
jgi:ribosome-associated heat shock protein Hsp15